MLGFLDDAVAIAQAHHIDEVVIALPLHAHARLANLVARLNELPLRVHIVPDYFDLAFHGATIESVGGLPLIGLRDPAIDGFQRFGKRLMDIALAGAGLLLLSPAMLAVALAIKLEDHGPVFYRAERVGENGRHFRMLKFRSMVVNADKLQHLVNQRDGEGHLLFKYAGDPHHASGDSSAVPASTNCRNHQRPPKGDMSLVGPPELPWLVEKYEPWQRKRFAVPQGITGWWQVNGAATTPCISTRSKTSITFQHYSWWLDIEILWRTVAVVLRGRGHTEFLHPRLPLSMHLLYNSSGRLVCRLSRGGYSRTWRWASTSDNSIHATNVRTRPVTRRRCTDVVLVKTFDAKSVNWPRPSPCHAEQSEASHSCAHFLRRGNTPYERHRSALTSNVNEMQPAYSPYDDEIDLRKYLDILIAWWKEILLLGVVAAVAAGLGVFVLRAIATPQYEAKADIVMARLFSEIALDQRVSISGDSQGTNVVSRRAALVALVRSGIIAQAVSEELGDLLSAEERAPSKLLEKVQAETLMASDGRTASDLIRVTVTADDPEKAATIANAWAKHYIRQANTVFGQIPQEGPRVGAGRLDGAATAHQAAYRPQTYTATSPIDTLQRQIGERSFVTVCKQVATPFSTPLPSRTAPPALISLRN